MKYGIRDAAGEWEQRSDGSPLAFDTEHQAHLFAVEYFGFGREVAELIEVAA